MKLNQTIDFKKLKFNIYSQPTMYIYDNFNKISFIFLYKDVVIKLMQNILVYSISIKHILFLEYYKNSNSILSLLFSKFKLSECKVYSSTLELVGIGYKWEIKCHSIYIHIGLSHIVKIILPNKIKSNIEINKLILKSTDLLLLNTIIYLLVTIKKKDPYKGKGIKTLYKNILLKKRSKLKK